MTADEKVNILMVDDEPSKLLSYHAILGGLGENLIQAKSASEALSVLLKTDVAVVLMDVSMPEIDGFELANIIHQHPRFNKTAIIFISGVHLSDSDRILGYRSGAVDYISVPVIPEVLRAKVSIFAELHRKTRQLENLNIDLERLVAERTDELRLSEQEFRKRAELLEVASEAITERGLEGNVKFWNSGAEALYGWKRDEAIGRDMHSMLKTIFPISREEVERVLQDSGSWQGNLFQTTRDGREIVVACRKTMNHEGNAVLEVGRDITAQIRAEEALRESEKHAAMGRVAGIIAHEVNNPLAAITNIFYLLRAHPSLNQEARQLADLAEQELQRMSHITRQTLSFYRESKQPVPVTMHTLVDDVLELQRREIQAKNIHVHKKYTSTFPVHGFPVELRQVMMNLINNAIQATPQRGRLRIHVLDSTDWNSQQHGTAVCVTDTGVGIHPQDAERLFEPFFSTKADKGTGLGLWISRGIVQKYGGQISFRCLNQKSGSATCFRAFFPSNFCLTRRVNKTEREHSNEQLDSETVMASPGPTQFGAA
jgi:two-component system, NtrC family, sensor kinase